MPLYSICIYVYALCVCVCVEQAKFRERSETPAWIKSRSDGSCCGRRSTVADAWHRRRRAHRNHPRVSSSVAVGCSGHHWSFEHLRLVGPLQQRINATTVRIQQTQANHRCQTSPALCNPTSPFAAERPHRLRPEICRILFALAWHTEWSLLLHDVIGDWMIPFAAIAAATAAAKIANAFEWPGLPPKIAPSLWGICTPSNTWFL